MMEYANKIGLGGMSIWPNMEAMIDEDCVKGMSDSNPSFDRQAEIEEEWDLNDRRLAHVNELEREEIVVVSPTLWIRDGS